MNYRLILHFLSQDDRRDPLNYHYMALLFRECKSLKKDACGRVFTFKETYIPTVVLSEIILRTQ